MSIAPTLADLTDRTGIDVFDYLDRSIRVPILDAPQAQGDLIVIPFAMLAGVVAPVDSTRRYDVAVTGQGIELLRNETGGNPHTLVADPGLCTWISRVKDPRGLALGILDTQTTAYLIHPEHGASGIAPGRYVIGRQRERGFRGWRANQFVVD